MQVDLDKFYDIYPSVHIHTLVPLYALVMLLFLIASLSFITYTVYKKIKFRKKPLSDFSDIDFSDYNQRDLLYDFSIYSQKYLKKHNITDEDFGLFLQELEPYKYKKNVEKIPDTTIKQMKGFIKKWSH